MIFVKQSLSSIIASISIVIGFSINAGGEFIFKNNDPSGDVSLEKITWNRCKDDTFKKDSLIIHPGDSHAISWSWMGPAGNCELTRIKFTKLERGMEYPFEFSFNNIEAPNNFFDDAKLVCEFNSRSESLLDCSTNYYGKRRDTITATWDPSW